MIVFCSPILVLRNLIRIILIACPVYAELPICRIPCTGIVTDDKVWIDFLGSKVIQLYIYMYLFFFFQILSPLRLLHNIEQNSLYDWFYFHKNNKTCFTHQVLGAFSWRLIYR